MGSDARSTEPRPPAKGVVIGELVYLGSRLLGIVLMTWVLATIVVLCALERLEGPHGVLLLSPPDPIRARFLPASLWFAAGMCGPLVVVLLFITPGLMRRACASWLMPLVLALLWSASGVAACLLADSTPLGFHPRMTLLAVATGILYASWSTFAVPALCLRARSGLTAEEARDRVRQQDRRHMAPLLWGHRIAPVVGMLGVFLIEHLRIKASYFASGLVMALPLTIFWASYAVLLSAVLGDGLRPHAVERIFGPPEEGSATEETGSL